MLGLKFSQSFLQPQEWLLGTFLWLLGSQTSTRILKGALSPSHVRHGTLVGSLLRGGLGDRTGKMTHLYLTSCTSDSLDSNRETERPLETFGENKGSWSVLERAHTLSETHLITLMFSSCAPAGRVVSVPHLLCEVIYNLQRNTYRHE